jgi:hypothetical protein
MSEEDKEGEKAKVSADGTFYDDEVSRTIDSFDNDGSCLLERTSLIYLFFFSLFS